MSLTQNDLYILDRFMSFQKELNTTIRKQVMKELGIKNPLAAPRVVKIVVNVGAGEAVVNKNVIGKIIPCQSCRSAAMICAPVVKSSR